MQLALVEGVPVQPRKAKAHRSSRSSNGHRHSPYEGNQNTRPRSSGSHAHSLKGRGGERVLLANLTNSPKKDLGGESLTGLMMKVGEMKRGVSVGMETPERKGVGVDSPGDVDWFMAPRKGGIGKA